MTRNTLRKHSRRSWAQVVVILLGSLGALIASQSAAGAAVAPTACSVEVTADGDLRVEVQAANADEIALDQVGSGYQFLGRHDVDAVETSHVLVIGPDNPAGFIRDGIEVDIRARSIGTDGSKSDRIACGSVTRNPRSASVAPAFCFARPATDGPAQGFLGADGFIISDTNDNRFGYDRLVFEQFSNGTWSEADSIRITDDFDIGPILGEVSSVRGVFQLDDFTLRTRVRASSDGVLSASATVCGLLPTTPVSVAAPTCQTSPHFYFGVNQRPILGFKAIGGAGETSDFVFEQATTLEVRYLLDDGTVARVQRDTKWKDIPSGTYTVEIRSTVGEDIVLGLPASSSAWVTCGTEIVP